MPVVTIRGQLGSGATEIGRLVAERIRGDYVDREIIAGVAARVQAPSGEVADKEEPPGSLAGRILEALGKGTSAGAGAEGFHVPAYEIPLGDRDYLEGLTAVIKDLARSPSLVIRGRGSQFILKDLPGALHVLVVAPPEIRVKRVMETLGLEEGAAKKEMDRVDGSRREFIRRYFNADLEDPAHYHLVINTEHLSFERAAELITTAADLLSQSQA